MQHKSIDPIAVTAAALKVCHCAADYHQLSSITEPSVFQAAWDTLLLGAGYG